MVMATVMVMVMVMVISTVMVMVIVMVMVMATVTVMVMALRTLGKLSETVGEVVDVGAEQVSFSSSSAAPRCSWVTVKLRATTFFRLDVFLATFEMMSLH